MGFFSGLFDTPKAPKAPDPMKTAQAQTQSNINTGIANSVLGNANEVGPLGSVTYKQTGMTDVNGQQVPQWTRTTTLSPEQQKLYDQQTGLGSQLNTIAGNQLNAASSMLSSPLNFDSAPAAPTADRQQYVDALNARLDPQLQRDRAALETRLANQGVMPGSEAYREAIALNDRKTNDSRQQAILNAGTYADQEYSMGTDARSRAINEQLTLRNQPLNEIQTMMSGGQPTMPQFSAYQGGNIAGTDIAGITQNNYSNQLKAYQNELNSQNSMLGGIGSIAGTILGGPIGGALGGAMFGGLGGGGSGYGNSWTPMVTQYA